MDTATGLARIRNIAKALPAALALAIILSYGPAVLALDQMGPPVAGLEQGQFKAGVDFSYGEMDLETKDGSWVEYLDGAFLDAGEATNFTLEDFKTAKTFVNFGYGFADICEGFLRVGGTKGSFDDSIWLDSEEFDSGSELAAGGGVKATFFEDGGLRVGGLLQGSWGEYHGKLDAPHWAAPDFVELDLTEVQIAFGAAYTWEDRLTVYGGPFFHFVSGDLEDTVTEVDTISGGLLNSEYVWELDEDSVFGGYFGAQLEIAESCSVSLEYQKTGAADAFGASILWRF